MNLEQLINDNTNLIWKIAQNFYGIDKNDLFQAGALGITKAYKNYQKNGNTKFSTYAYEYIFGEMYVLASNRNIKISKDFIRLNNMIEKTRYALAQKLMRIPTNKEIADFLDKDEYLINMAINSANIIMSIDEEKEDARLLHETIEDKKIMNYDDKILLDSSFEVLDDLEQNIITSRYYEDLSQTETARKLGITQVMVSRYEKRSLAKMKDYIHM